MNKKAVILILSLAVSAADTLLGAHVTDLGNTNAPLSAEVMRDLTEMESRQYIDDEGGFRTQVKQSGQQVRLNLGNEFRKYMVDKEFRDRVNALVEKPPKQIWSDVSILDLS